MGSIDAGWGDPLSSGFPLFGEALDFRLGRFRAGLRSGAVDSLGRGVEGSVSLMKRREKSEGFDGKPVIDLVGRSSQPEESRLGGDKKGRGPAQPRLNEGIAGCAYLFQRF